MILWWIHIAVLIPRYAEMAVLTERRPFDRSCEAIVRNATSCVSHVAQHVAYHWPYPSPSYVNICTGWDGYPVQNPPSKNMSWVWYTQYQTVRKKKIHHAWVATPIHKRQVYSWLGHTSHIQTSFFCSWYTNTSLPFSIFKHMVNVFGSWSNIGYQYVPNGSRKTYLKWDWWPFRKIKLVRWFYFPLRKSPFLRQRIDGRVVCAFHCWRVSKPSKPHPVTPCRDSFVRFTRSKHLRVVRDAPQHATAGDHGSSSKGCCEAEDRGQVAAGVEIPRR